MANEIQVNVSLLVNNGRLNYSQVPGSLQFDMSGTKSVGGTFTTSSSATAVAIPLSNLTSTTCGYSYFRNTSSTAGQNVLIGTGTGTFVPFMELKPGEVAVLRLASSSPGVVPTCRSASGSPVLQYWIAEN